MALEEDDIFKESDIPLGEDEDEEMEEEEEELNSLEKVNEPEHENEDEDMEEDEEQEQQQEQEQGADDEEDEEENDVDGTRDTADSPATSVSTKEVVIDDEAAKHQAFYKSLIMKASLADSYDIVPKVAIPHATGINCFALPKTSKWLFTGGEDGFIRKYDFFASIDGEIQLTSAQRHSLVDLITNAGVLLAYWDNEIPVKRSSIKGDTYEPKLSPVYSLAVENNCLWLLGGLSTGGINLQSIRHNEGRIVHHFKGHSNSVSVLQLNQRQDQFLSGSWDNNIIQWDLNTGNQIANFKDSTGQISSIQYRPSGGISLDQAQQAQPDDDDMDSLFGDDDDDDDNRNNVTDKPKENNQPGDPQSEVDENVFLSSSVDGSLYVWDVRTHKHVLRLKPPKGTPPWCVSACWSYDGNSIFAGRRNSCVEEFSLKMPFNSSGDPTPARTLKFPSVSGAVTAVSALPNHNHVVCGSYDNIRIYDLRLHSDSQKKTPFLIVPGHHGGTVCDIMFDPTYRYMISASGNRGWQGSSIETAFVYEVGIE